MRRSATTARARRGHLAELSRRREAARGAARSEALLRAVLDHTDNAILALDAEHRVSFYNERYVQSFGVPRELLDARARLETLMSWACRRGLYPAEEEARLVAERLTQLTGADGPRTIEVPRTDGVRMEAYATALPGGGHLLAFRDVTECRRAEEALRSAKEFAERLVGSTPMATFVLDVGHRVVLWNPACEELTGVTASEVIGTSLHWRAFYPEPRPCLADLVLDGREAEAARLYEESGEAELAPSGFRAAGWYDALGGKRRYIAFEAAPIVDRTGRLIGALETIQDITALKHAEEELARLGAAVDQAAEAIVVTDEEGRALYVNPAFERLTRFGRREALALGAREAAWIPSDAWPTLRRGEAWSGRGPARRRDGSGYHEEVTVSPVRNRAGHIAHYVAIRMDVTQEEALQRRLAQGQRLEALGTLAGGIAHDFNNILTAIVGFTEMTRDDLPEGSVGRDNLDQVLVAGERARDLVSQVLAFSRPGDEAREPVALGPMVTETLKLLRATLPEAVEVREELRAPAAVVAADPTQLRQVILNLCTNAGQAMGDRGGVLTVTVDETPAGGSGPGVPRWVTLTVQDTGPGIAPEVADHIFEPFFTTKEVGEGTGLGLSVVHGIVSGHDGEITVTSRPGEGATFRVRLPRSPG